MVYVLLIEYYVFNGQYCYFLMFC